MANATSEAQFVALFWRDAAGKTELASRIMSSVHPEMLEYQEFSTGYELLRQQMAAGAEVDDMETVQKMHGALGDWIFEVKDAKDTSSASLRSSAASVVFSHRCRTQAAILSDAANNTVGLIEAGSEAKARKVADTVISSLSDLHYAGGDDTRPVTRGEITEAAIKAIREKKDKSSDIILPYDKMKEAIGPLIPGDVMGIAAYSNAGKSTVLANMWGHLAIQGIPTISFPTEMGLAWHARGVAAYAKVPQAFAERGQWDEATEEQRERYEFALRELEACPWDIIPNMNVTVDEIIARATILRKKYKGKPVAILIDHMHRLNYGRGEADFDVGKATRRLRNWIRNDQDGGMVGIFLYQPRKPSDDLELYKPVQGYQMRGKSEVWNELDYMISPYRRWVRTNPNMRTPWGTPLCDYDPDGTPSFAPIGDKFAKVDDEHSYIKVVKRRVGGEGPTMMLNIDAPSGKIYEVPKPQARVGS